MKIVAVGDPHGTLKRISNDADLFLLTGDLGSSELMRKMHFSNIDRRKKGLPEIEYSPAQKKRAFMEAYNSTIKLVKSLAKIAPVYTIFGNVESSNKDTREQAKEIGLKLPFLYNNLNKIKNVRVLNNKIANFDGLRIGGLDYFLDVSWVKEFRPSDFKKNMTLAKRETDKAKKILRSFGYVDILLCHQPPYGILDEVSSKFAPRSWHGKHAGSKAVLGYIKKNHPAYVFCGHIHEAKGMRKIGKTEVYNLGVSGYKIINPDSN